MDKNQKEVLKKLAHSNIAENRVRNKVLIIAIAAVSILLLTIMGAGFSYVRNFTVMNLRLKGTNAQGFVHGISDEKAAGLGEIDEINSLGRQYFVGTADEPDNSLLVAVSAYDENEWRENILPTVKNFAGKRPEKANEILLSKAVINAWGLEEEFVLGMEITLRINNTKINEPLRFQVVGTYEDFVSSSLRNPEAVSGNLIAAGMQLKGEEKIPEANCVVSEELAKKVCNADGIYTTFRIGHGEEIEKIIVDKLKLDQTGRILIADGKSGSGKFAGILLAITVSSIVCLCGYLCIYNIMNISLLRDIHFWGNLKAIGAGINQLKYIADYETNFFILRALPTGFAIGAVLTLGFVPFILKTFIGSGGYSEIMPMTMSYSVWIFLAAAFFCYLTVFMSFRKAIRMLAIMSPIEALRFNGERNTVKTFKERIEQKRCNGKIYKMAWYNVFNERKKFLTVIGTLFLGLFLYLFSYTLFSSPDWDLYLDKESPEDFMIRDSAIVYNQNPQFLNEEIFDRLKAIDGIRTIEKIYLQPASLKSGSGGDLFCTVAGISTEKIKQYQLEGGGDYTAEDLQDFVEGEKVYIKAPDTGSGLELVGKNLNIYCGNEKGGQLYRIAGVLKKAADEEKYNPEELGFAMSKEYLEKEQMRIFMSEAGLRKIAANPVIYQIEINAKKEKEPMVKKQIKDFLGTKVSVVCRSDLLPLYQPVAKSMIAVGTVISGILLIIGVMNFINSISASIYARIRELAVLSGIGMSKRQIITMLVWEGGYYALVTFSLLGTLGVGAIYLLMHLVKDELYFFEFLFPIRALGLVFVLLSAICLAVPYITYWPLSEQSVADRLKNSED